MLTNLIFSEVNGGFFDILRSDRLDEQARATNVVLVVDPEANFVFREHDELWSSPAVSTSVEMISEEGLPQDGHTSDSGFPKGSVPHGQHAVPQAQNVIDNALVGLFQQVWFTALGVNMGVSSEERSKGSNLIPANEHLGLRVAEEATDIS